MAGVASFGGGWPIPVFAARSSRLCMVALLCPVLKTAIDRAPDTFAAMPKSVREAVADSRAKGRPPSARASGAMARREESVARQRSCSDRAHSTCSILQAQPFLRYSRSSPAHGMCMSRRAGPPGSHGIGRSPGCEMRSRRQRRDGERGREVFSDITVKKHLRGAGKIRPGEPAAVPLPRHSGGRNLQPGRRLSRREISAEFYNRRRCRRRGIPRSPWSVVMGSLHGGRRYVRRSRTGRLSEPRHHIIAGPRSVRRRSAMW